MRLTSPCGEACKTGRSKHLASIRPAPCRLSQSTGWRPPFQIEYSDSGEPQVTALETLCDRGSDAPIGRTTPDFPRHGLRVRRAMEFNADMKPHAQDALLGLLAPIWQLAIMVCLIVVTVVAGYKLLMRGPSRMLRGVVMAGSAVVGVIVIGMLFSMT